MGTASEAQLIDVKRAWLPLTSALAIGAVLFNAWLFVDGQIRRIDTLERELEVMKHERMWSCAQQELFMSKLQTLNPQFKLPNLPKACEL